MNALLMTLIVVFAVPAANAKKIRSLTCPKKYPAKIYVPFNDVMTIEFPEKPKTSLPGNNKFDFQFINNDLAVKSLSSNGKANLFVYLKNDKCVFKLVTRTKSSDDVVRVKYPKETTIEVEYVR